MGTGTDALAVLGAWSAWSVGEVVEALHALAERRRAGLPVRLPWVTLHLRSGRDVEGFVRELVETRQGHSVLIHAPGPDPRSPRADAVFVPMATVEALTLHEVSVLDAVDDESPAPSLLAVRRNLAAVGERLGAGLGAPLAVEAGAVTERPEDARALAHLADRATEVLDALAADPAAREALKEKVRRVHLQVGRDFAVALSGGTLTVTTGHRPADWPTRRELADAVDAVL